MSFAPLSKKVKSIDESATLEMAQMARDLKEKGYDVINMSLGEPDFDTPDDIKEAAKKALDDGFTKYSPVPGIPQIREAIVKKLKRDNNLDYKTNQIVVTNGAKQAIASVCTALLDPGDEVILFSPYWVSHESIVKVSEGTPIPLKATIENDFKVTAKQLKEAITPKTKMILYSSPCNPTGMVYSEEELREIAEVLRDHPNIYVVSDEIYEYINFGKNHYSIASFDFIKERVIIINGMSKGFSMTGWRLGYMAAPCDIAKACIKVQGQSTSGANTFSQVAAAYALGKGKYQYMVDKFQERRDFFIKLLKEIPGIKVNEPEGAFYLFPDVSYFFGKTDGKDTITDSSKFAELILKNALVAIVPGEPFGDSNCVRFSYATSMELIEEAANRMKKYLKNFK